MIEETIVTDTFQDGLSEQGSPLENRSAEAPVPAPSTEIADAEDSLPTANEKAEEEAPVEKDFVNEPDELDPQKREFLLKRVERIERMADNYAAVEARIAQICEPLEKDPAQILLYIPHRGVESKPLMEASLAGVRCFSEDRPKIMKQVTDLFPETSWIYTGRIENTVMDELVRSSNTVFVVKRTLYLSIINLWCSYRGLTASVLFDANLSGDGSQPGVAPAYCINSAREMTHMPYLTLAGLAIDLPEDPETAAKKLEEARKLNARIQKQFSEKCERIQAKEIMIKNFCDYEVSIEGGATILPVPWRDVIVTE